MLRTVTDSIDLQLESYAYDLDPSLIAQEPVSPRDASRLLVHHRDTDQRQDRQFSDLPEFLTEADLLVLNETRVFPARVFGTSSRGRDVELLLVRALSDTRWESLIRPGRKIRDGEAVSLEDGTVARVVERLGDGSRVVEFSRAITPEWLESFGAVPLPPYIDRPAEQQDRERYQTVYAVAPGSVAAPTAGLHFTDELLRSVDESGVRRTSVVLHVGPGTFRPVRTGDIRDHAMDREHFSVGADTLEALRDTRSRGGRIVAVGTTTVRTLETLARDGLINSAGPVAGWTEIFIHPPHRFQLVDALITNFHLPKSTLLMLVSAFAGREKTLEIYRHAVERKYRFYSYGDAMLLL